MSAVPAGALGRPGRIRRGVRGQATIEFGGMALLLFIGALFAWQMGLVAWTAVSVNNAVRTASRLASRGDSISDAEQQGRNSLSGHYLQKGSVNVYLTSGGQTAYADAKVPIPIVLPGLFDKGLTLSADAKLPVTH